MSKNMYDKKFVKNLKKIIVEGTDYQSRAVWQDLPDTPFANCRKVFGLVTKYNTNNENTPPIGTLRRLAIKNCVDELLWIWQKKSNNIHDLNSHVWDDWADANGSIGMGYGFQVRSKIHKVQQNTLLGKDEHGNEMFDVQPLYLDQIDYVIWKLKHDKYCRRIITNLYDIGSLEYMGLDPCCYMCTWNVTKEDGKEYLNLLLNQRSQDMMVANNWNVFQYWVLQNLLALECNLEVGQLVHVIADAHIYDRHIELAEELISAYETGHVYYEPEIVFDFKDFYSFTSDDVHIGNYEYYKHTTKIPVAV